MNVGDLTETARPVDLTGMDGAGGVVWSVSPDGLHANLVVLGPHETIAPHRADTVDVLVVVLAGAGTVTIDGNAVGLTPTAALVLPCSAERAITAGAGGLRYLTVHARREPLTITTRKEHDV